MSETTFRVPLQGTNVTSGESASGEQESEVSGFHGGVFEPVTRTKNERARYQARNGLGQTIARARGETEAVTEWQEDRRGGGGFVTTRRPVQRQPEAPAPPDAYGQQVDGLTKVVSALVDRVAPQQDTGPQLPNPAAYDFYDPQSEGQYHVDLQKYVEAQKQEALKPHQAAIQQTELARYYNEAANEYRDHPNFAEIEAAAQYALKHYDGKSSLQEIFANAVDPAKARPGWAGNIHTPKQLRGKIGSVAAHRAMIKKAWGR